MTKYLFSSTVLILFVGIVLFLLSRNASLTQVISPLAASPNPTYILFPTHTPSAPLGNAIQNALVGTLGSYGIVVKHLKTGEFYVSNEHKIYKSGSLYKLWVMAVVYKQIQNGSLHKDDVLKQSIVTLNNEFFISPEYAEQTDGSIELSVSDALDQMITISDNYAALLLADKVGIKNIASFLQDNGFGESKVGINGNDPTITPYDTAIFFEKLYKGEFADKTYTDEMLKLLKTQKLNDKIPKYLPEDIMSAHKTGELDQFTHDAGIVYTTTGDYIIVVLSESDDPLQAKERIANVSKAVYTHFAK